MEWFWTLVQINDLVFFSEKIIFGIQKAFIDFSLKNWQYAPAKQKLNSNVKI